MCLIDHVLHQYGPVDDSVCLQLKDSEEMADKKKTQSSSSTILRFRGVI